MEKLRKLQLTEQEIFDEIARVCEENNLRYYMVGGTLLGAVRHEGFIPWDDDLDIAMPRDDFNRFIQICKTQLNEKYFLHWITTDERYWLPFAKVRKKGTAVAEANLRGLDVHKEIYVDIFPLDNAIKVNGIKQKIITFIIKRLNSALTVKLGVQGYDTSMKGRIKRFIISIIALLPFSAIHNMAQKYMCLNNKNDTCEYYINYGSNYKTETQTMPKNKFDDACELLFEGKMYKAPKDYDYFLSRLYGDYMELPPKEKRVLRHSPDYIIFGDEDNEKI